MPDEEHEAILGLSEFEKSVNLFHEKKYTESENYLKEALKILKNAKQEKSMGYVFLLKRLAHTCFVNRKFAESEKFFMVCADLTGKVTNNLHNKFNAQKNLLILYTHTDI